MTWEAHLTREQALGGVVLIILVAVALLSQQPAPQAPAPQPPQEPATPAQPPVEPPTENTPAMHCADMGGTMQGLKCVFGNGASCDAQAYLEGECKIQIELVAGALTSASGARVEFRPLNDAEGKPTATFTTGHDFCDDATGNWDCITQDKTTVCWLKSATTGAQVELRVDCRDMKEPAKRESFAGIVLTRGVTQ
jgi:hypothetical protein